MEKKKCNYTDAAQILNNVEGSLKKALEVL
jgi:hypothetical protein